MKRRIAKWGKGLAIRIPKALADEAGLKEDDIVELIIENGKLVIVTENSLTLEMILSKVRDDQLHGEIDTGPSVGNEAW